MRRFRLIKWESAYGPLFQNVVYDAHITPEGWSETIEECAKRFPDEWQEVFEPESKPEIEKLQAFKDYVHKRLDEAGIEKNPNGEHSKHGCRIGDRLDLVLKPLHKDTDLGYYAGLAMQGLLSNSGQCQSFAGNRSEPEPIYLSEYSILLAKELIKQLDQETK